MATSQLTEAWQINNRINLYLLDAIDAAHLGDALSTKGRNAGEQFAHIHNVRLMWVKAAAPELAVDLLKIETEKANDKAFLKNQLEKSGDAIASLIEAGVKSGRIKGFKPHPEAFAGYMIAHDSHHRSQIVLALKNCGHAVDKKVMYGMWEWGVR